MEGIVTGSFCPHYDGEINRRPSFHQMIHEGQIAPGYAADDGAAAHFIDEQLSTSVCSRQLARVYKVDKTEDQVHEEVIETHFLGVKI